ncbi:MAG: elongation factor P maturation arginine rhamnosyltransferase EarP [Comamonadaceae bacterium]|nr:MAG: elongation factor P maturation arginine rhamnosyltransferase EarP [Comamonadaceae bacterium]
MLWDIFCKVIDNHGDIGVCWRLASQLARRGEQVRLWVDDSSALSWMAPQGQAGVSVAPWPAIGVAAAASEVVIEAFGCALDESFEASVARQAAARGRQPVWINLEYLSAEPFAERSHGLPSPVMHGPARGLVKHFFYPGFAARTGGLLREPELTARQAGFDRAAWLAQQGIAHRGERLVSLFCYEPPALPALLAQLAAGPLATRLLVTAGRAQAAVQAAIQSQNSPLSTSRGHAALSISYLPLLVHADFDHLLQACDFNFVRGEDSLVRALWAGRPFAWQIYPQHDGVHHAKLEAFLDWLGAPPALRALHAVWNGAAAANQLPPLHEAGDAACVQAALPRLLLQDDLVTQLLAFVAQRA